MAPLTAQREERARAILYDDLTSEYDARFLSAHVRALGLPFTAAFRAAEAVWERDEREHYEAFLELHERCFGFGERERVELARRRPDFGPLAHLFADELSIACLFAYDELCTVFAYRANLELYDACGAGALVRRVVRDEGRHYRAFLEVLRGEHADRRSEIAAAVDRIRGSEGIAYASTFVLDHDDRETFTPALCDRAMGALLRAVG